MPICLHFIGMMLYTTGLLPDLADTQFAFRVDGEFALVHSFVSSLPQQRDDTSVFSVCRFNRNRRHVADSSLARAEGLYLYISSY